MLVSSIHVAESVRNIMPHTTERYLSSAELREYFSAAVGQCGAKFDGVAIKDFTLAS